MTREEALKYSFELEDRLYPFDKKSLAMIVNKIYDDFESKTCENCKWLISNEIKRCKLNVISNIHMHLSNGTYDERFGCNKFERKTDVHV